MELKEGEVSVYTPSLGQLANFKNRKMLTPYILTRLGMVLSEKLGTGLFVKPDSSMYFRDCGNIRNPRE